MILSPFISHSITETIYLRINYNLLPDNASIDFKAYAVTMFLSALTKQDVGLESYLIHNRLNNNFNSKEEISEDIILNFSINKKISRSEINEYLLFFSEYYLVTIPEEKRYSMSLNEMYLGDKDIIDPIHLKNWLSLVMMNKYLYQTLPDLHENIMREKI